MTYKPSNIKAQLCSLCLKEFYNILDNESVGVITNTKSGSMLYDMLEWANDGLEIDKTIKESIWKTCKDDYNIIQDTNISSVDKHKELLKELYKCRLIEYWLNVQHFDNNKRIIPNIAIPKLNAHYHKFRLIREE